MRKSTLLVLVLFLPLLLYTKELQILKTVTLKNEKKILSNNYAPWNSNSLELFLKRQDNIIGSLKGEKLSRSSLDDERIESSFAMSIFKNIQWTISYTKANKGVIIPKTIIFNKFLFNINKFLLVSLARKNNEYSSEAQSDTNTIELISYYKNFRFAYAHDITDVKDVGQSTNDKIATHYFYGNHYTAFSLSLGKELEALPNDSTLSSNVDSVSIYGQYWFFRQWGLGYSADYTKQGDIYIKKGVSLAAIHRF